MDLDGRVPRVYVQRNGLGHAFVTVGERNETVVYSYGRYGTLYETSGLTSGKFTPKGEGVMVRYTGKEAALFLSDVKQEGNLDVFQINTGNDAVVAKFYDYQFYRGYNPTNKQKPTYGNPNARVIDIYSLIKNNCVTTTINGLNSVLPVIDSDAITPIGLSYDLQRQSTRSESIIQIENVDKFLEMLVDALIEDYE